MTLTINEVARCLNLPINTIERWVRQGRIPIQKTADGYIYKKSVLKKWAADHNLNFSLPEKGGQKEPESRLENLLPVMARGGVFHNIPGNDVKTVLKAAVENMSCLSQDDRKELYERLLEREELTSTGIGKGVAMPHPRSPLSVPPKEPLITTCFLENPVEFYAVDDKPVFVMFILVSTSTKMHLHLLSRLAFCVRDSSFVDFLKTSPNSDDLLSKIADFEKKLD
ncbi:PTS sugar transporter subunit IIA [Desulfonema magnum]|uniref:Phosphoenolpyruvate-dependent sugar phosphotransferase system EIIA 2-type domain-containing protein n=1 Tax=Desulfonema magnum TaxID=45655 RepID=A0A975GSL7_9BACT|nr:PTS sugar transporter subunit IIA [Desulfonema magnum]QTA91213.1 Phosphoenolpyruvate-dependent sugar phosphotransferase system EIIA 2-type domain-containing protein [Desulfonema magnum]